MSIQSRIEADLSEQNTPSQSRIEQILNGEQITPRSRIEQLLQEYNPEDPGSYHKVECTKAQYDNMQSHSSNTIYVVTYPDQSVHFYLGDDEIEGEPVLITKNITSNDTYNASDDDADGYSSVTVNVPSVTPTLIEKTITENGIYDAEDDDADGYSAVTINVPVNMEIVPYGTLVPNTYIASGNGEERSYNGCSATGYIEIDPDNYYYVFTGKLTAQYGDDWDPTTNAYYDANKTYISGFSNNAGSGAPSGRDDYFHEFPSTAKYIRISQEASAFSDYKSFIARIKKSYINPNA